MEETPSDHTDDAAASGSTSSSTPSPPSSNSSTSSNTAFSGYHASPGARPDILQVHGLVNGPTRPRATVNKHKGPLHRLPPTKERQPHQARPTPSPRKNHSGSAVWKQGRDQQQSKTRQRQQQQQLRIARRKDIHVDHRQSRQPAGGDDPEYSSIGDQKAKELKKRGKTAEPKRSEKKKNLMKEISDLTKAFDRDESELERVGLIAIRVCGAVKEKRREVKALTEEVQSMETAHMQALGQISRVSSLVSAQVAKWTSELVPDQAPPP